MKIGKYEAPIEGFLSAACLSVLVILLGLQVVLRFVFGRTLAWSEELSRFAFVWGVYFGFVLAAHENKHIRVTVALWALPNRIRIAILTFADLLWVIFNGLVVYYGIDHTLQMIEYEYKSQTLGINLLFVFMIVPIGFAWMTVRVIQNAIKRLRGELEMQDSRLDTV